MEQEHRESMGGVDSRAASEFYNNNAAGHAGKAAILCNQCHIS